MKILFLIPARGGSKGIPHKNIKMFNGKPLICHAIDCARQFASDKDICVSTDDDQIIKVVENYGLKVPFKRPDELASDCSGSYEVMLHAINFFEKQGHKYDTLVLLQPTSPFRSHNNVLSAIKVYRQSKGKMEMVTSVKEATANPYYNCFEPDDNGFLRHSKGDGKIVRRQDAPKAYEYNGAVYVMSIEALKQKPHTQFDKVGYAIMDEIHSLDLDTTLDWKLAELILKEKLL